MCKTLCDNEKLTRGLEDLVKVVKAHNEISCILFNMIAPGITLFALKVLNI